MELKSIYPLHVFPGVVGYYCYFPTEIDPVGLDGVYYYMTVIYDLEKFMDFKTFTGRPIFYFPWN